MSSEKKVAKSEKKALKAEKKAAKRSVRAEKAKTPITHYQIYKIMLIVTFSVAGAFLLINVIKLNIPGMIAIGGSLLAFAAVLWLMKLRKAKSIHKEFVACIALELLIFVISLFSGESYSDDFPMFLAVIGMTGMYMEPKFTKVQIVTADVLLVAMLLIHPEKAGGLTQFLLCLVIFTLAAILVFLAIKRGRAFIDIARDRAEESEKLLNSIQDMGEKLETDFTASSDLIAESARSLEKGSADIIREAGEVAESCGDVQDRIRVTNEHIVELNGQVRKFEASLNENGTNMEAMQTQLRSVSEIITQTSQAVSDMKHQMNEVANIAVQLSDISFRTTLLSLNASVEAAHAGSAGAGFAVVASEMKNLSENSDRFSDRVSEVVNQLLNQVETISEQFEGSSRELERSEQTMNELQDSFSQLTKRFEKLYDNIEEQTQCVEQVDSIFGQLKKEVQEMKFSSAENKTNVAAIAVAMDEYRESIGRVVENTKVK